MKVNVNLFKESGKWAYGGVVEIDADTFVNRGVHMQALVDSQDFVNDGTFDHYAVVVTHRESYETDPSETGFCQALYSAGAFRGMRKKVRSRGEVLLSPAELQAVCSALVALEVSPAAEIVIQFNRSGKCRSRAQFQLQPDGRIGLVHHNDGTIVAGESYADRADFLRAYAHLTCEVSRRVVDPAGGDGPDFAGPEASPFSRQGRTGVC